MPYLALYFGASGMDIRGSRGEILTDQGTQFLSARERDVAHHMFKEFLDGHGIKHIITRVRHNQTNVGSVHEVM